MALRISQDNHARLLGWAAESPSEEICGLLFGSFDRVDSVARTPNVASEPKARFEIDPAQLVAAHRAAREGGPPVLGCFHSHPNGATEPSPRDAASALPDGSIWLILAAGTMTAWRATASGHLHGRFDPVPILQC